MARSTFPKSPSSPAAKTYRGDQLLQIAMPMGGIGAGNICLNGHGGLQDFSIRNAPTLHAMAEWHDGTPAGFGLLHLPGRKPVTKLLEGPLPPPKIYNQGLLSQGYRKGGYEGLPRFEECRFTAEYPFGHVDLADTEIPLQVRVTGFSPFIPNDDKNSGLPCVILEYTFTNPTRKPIPYEFSYHLSHLAQGSKGEKATRNRVIPNAGVELLNTEHPNHETFGSASLSVAGHKPKIKAMWLRAPGWTYAGITALWKECSTGRFTANAGSTDQDQEGRNGGSILLQGTLKPGESATHPIIITWYFPNVNITQGGLPQDTACCTPGSSCCPAPGDVPAPKWRPWYVTQWKDAADVAAYVRTHYASLRARTAAFARALFASTVPAEVLDAVSCNLAILKSSTVLRQESGNVWGWEGCFSTAGCCSGTCTHVWNYAQAMPHLFPKLERTLREQELQRSMDDKGHVHFRAALPDGPTTHDWHAAADGQLGGIMKVYRDWQISGDRAWMESLYPLVRRSMEFCIRHWDPQRSGALMEPHHNTYDIEFWGPDGMCTSIYVGALAAIAAMATELGHTEDAAAYRALAEKGAAFMDRKLFNGEYYQQKVEWKTLQNQSFAQLMATVNAGSDENLRLQKREGPNYQYGSGCHSDGVIGAWMSTLYGIDSPLHRDRVRQHLQAVFRHNFRADLFDHVNPQRPGYAMGHEPGLLLCTWPRGGKPTLPFIYSDEVWTGIEYQVASHLIAEGMVKEGLKLVKAARSRYDGYVRNPFNEYECGSYYARAMSSFALLTTLAGFRYSAASHTLWLQPKLPTRPFRTFFSAASGFGTLTLTRTELVIELTEGLLPVKQLHLLVNGQPKQMTVDLVATAGQPLRVKL